jgi:hypothetical protein
MTSSKSHLLKPLPSVEFVVSAVGGVPQVLHVGPDQHLAELVEVAVAVVLN